ncbi:hypothetical protein BS041_RS10675 [Vibrio parahaemolyticus]|uniref:hypothetical protein n=1 Tax=Vibrio parahaemolyticus TaxID=670 RepID=UPI0001BC6AFB|nr:hypothetical protein [Vibrio parahaemolyticus]EFO39599.1 conserved hypothetical protein [Vibrio parahaemolyticus AN-5034]EJG1963110.1 hypothetical protein [Vibrio parahaemolyticus]
MEDYDVMIKDENMGKFYANQLSTHGISAEWEESLSIKENKSIINAALKSYSFEDCKRIVGKIEEKYNSILYIKNETRKNERFCNFSWFYIQKKLSGKLSLNPNGNSFKERVKRVRIYITKVNESKHNYIELEMKIVRKWNLSLDKTEIISWLKDDEEKIKWAWSYILKHEPLVIKYIWNNKNSTKDLKDFIIAFFDTIEENKRDITIKRIKKAWDQKKFRDKVQSKKQYCINLSESSNEKLKAISISKNMKRNKVIESLINNEFLRL